MHSYSMLRINYAVGQFKNIRLCSYYSRSKISENCLFAAKIYKTNVPCNKKISLKSAGESLALFQQKVFRTLSESTPVEYTQNFLLNVHDSSGLPWWATIILTTCFLRATITFPLAIYQNYITAKVENITLEMNEIVNELKKETALAMHLFKWDEREARITYNRSIKKQWNKLILRDNCHPFKSSILIWIQIPMWIFISISYRNLTYMLPKCDVQALITYTELSLGGFGWIPNLTVPDASWILPVTLGLLNLAIIEIQIMSKIKSKSKFQVYISNLFRFISVALVPIAASVPSCLALYWVTSSSFGLLQNLTLLSPKFRRFTHIPQVPSESQRPYKLIWDKIKDHITVIPGIKSFQ